MRKDGYWRVTQDLRRESMLVFPFDYLDESSEIANYSTYVTEGVGSFLAQTGPDYTRTAPLPAMPSPAAGTFPTRTSVPTFTGEDRYEK